MTDKTAVTEPKPKTALRQEAYFCRICCSTFYGSAAIRHRQVNREAQASGRIQRLN